MTNQSGQGVAWRAFSGLRNDVSPERFTQGDMSVADNVDIEKTGRVSRRAGYTRRNATAARSLWSDGTLSLFASGTQLKRLAADFTTTDVAAIGAGDVSFCRVNDRVYLTDGSVSKVYDTVAGAARSWGLAVPALPTLATIATGSVPAGRYQCTTTYLRADGQESGALGATAIDVTSGQGLTVTLPVMPADAAFQNIYLTTTNGDLLYLAAAIARVGTPTVFTVTGSAVESLVLPLATLFLQPAPAGQLVTYYRGRMYVAVGSVVYMSEPLAYELFDLRNYIDLEAPVTMLAPMEDRLAPGLFIGTTASCGVLLGTGPEDFKYLAKVAYGAIPGTQTYIDGTLVADGSSGARQLPVWMTTQGVCIGSPLMEIVNHTRGRYEVGASGTGAGLVIPELNRYVAVTSTGTSVMRGENFAMTTYSNFAFNSFAAIGGRYFGASPGGIYELVGQTDAGAPIAASVKLGISDFGSPFEKGLERLYVGYRADAALQLTVWADNAQVAYALPVTNPAAPVHGSRVKIGKGTHARYWQFGLTNVSGGDFELDVLEVHPMPRQRRAHA